MVVQARRRTNGDKSRLTDCRTVERVNFMHHDRSVIRISKKKGTGVFNWKYSLSLNVKHLN